jgi:hypothetical protein
MDTELLFHLPSSLASTTIDSEGTVFAVNICKNATLLLQKTVLPVCGVTDRLNARY